MVQGGKDQEMLCVTTIPITIKIRGEHFIDKFMILVFKDIILIFLFYLYKLDQTIDFIFL